MVTAMETARCGKCATTKPATAFYRDRNRASGRHATCAEFVKAHLRARREADPEADRARQRAYYHANKEKHVEYGRRRMYGITTADYERMKAAQGGQCAACGRERPLHIDHDHDTGRVRGLLCSGCNRGIGFLGDDPARLRGAAEYLERAA